MKRFLYYMGKILLYLVFHIGEYCVYWRNRSPFGKENGGSEAQYAYRFLLLTEIPSLW